MNGGRGLHSQHTTHPMRRHPLHFYFSHSSLHIPSCPEALCKRDKRTGEGYHHNEDQETLTQHIEGCAASREGSGKVWKRPKQQRHQANEHDQGNQHGKIECVMSDTPAGQHTLYGERDEGQIHAQPNKTNAQRNPGRSIDRREGAGQERQNRRDERADETQQAEKEREKFPRS